MPTITDSSVSPAEGDLLKKAGQAASASQIAPVHRTVFMASIAALAPGIAFTANELRPVWDAAGIPNSARAVLMREACTAGLAQPVRIPFNGRDHAFKIPSTGRSARRAYVCVYRRAENLPEGP